MAKKTHEDFVRELKKNLPARYRSDVEEERLQKELERKFDELFSWVDDDD